jgi:hypothetical protein
MNKWFLLILSAFILCSLRLVNRDFYYDEVVTINNFLLCPIIDLFTKYTNLNNHIFYSLINNIYLNIIGVDSIDILLQHPWIIRLPSLIFPVATLVLIYRFGIKYFTPIAALLSVLLFATTIPFYYYSCAIRGYGLSILLMIVLFYSVWEHRYIFSIIVTTLLIYTMPSNAAFVIGLMFICLWEREFISLIALICGVSLAGLFYLPLFHQMFADPQLQAHNSRLLILTQSIPETINAFISYRWLLVPIAFYFIWKKRTRLFWWVSVITAVSIVLFLLSGSYLWARVMMPLFPLWCMVLAEYLGKIKK